MSKCLKARSARSAPSLGAASPPPQKAESQAAHAAAPKSRHRSRRDAEEIAGWDIDVRPDGQGPARQRRGEAGRSGLHEQCAACHGEFGESAGRWPQVRRRRARSRATIR